jgi:hypothetical protein
MISINIYKFKNRRKGRFENFTYQSDLYYEGMQWVFKMKYVITNNR